MLDSTFLVGEKNEDVHPLEVMPGRHAVSPSCVHGTVILLCSDFHRGLDRGQLDWPSESEGILALARSKWTKILKRLSKKNFFIWRH